MFEFVACAKAMRVDLMSRTRLAEEIQLAVSAEVPHSSRGAPQFAREEMITPWFMLVGVWAGTTCDSFSRYI